MTEGEWLTGTDPRPMLESLGGRATQRKLRLFVCACCRRLWDLLTDERTRRAVEVGEAFADGLVSDEVRRTAFRGACDASLRTRSDLWAAAASSAFAAAEHAGDVETLIHASDDPLQPVTPAARCQLLRELFGNSYCPASVAPSVLAWNDGAIPNLAASIYQGRAFDRLPILADALEEAGCSDALILAHCRQAGEHVRGCWVLDLLLARG